MRITRFEVTEHNYVMHDRTMFEVTSFRDSSPRYVPGFPRERSVRMQVLKIEAGAETYSEPPTWGKSIQLEAGDWGATPARREAIALLKNYFDNRESISVQGLETLSQQLETGKMLMTEDEDRA